MARNRPVGSSAFRNTVTLAGWGRERAPKLIIHLWSPKSTMTPAIVLVNPATSLLATVPTTGPTARRSPLAVLSSTSPSAMELVTSRTAEFGLFVDVSAHGVASTWSWTYPSVRKRPYRAVGHPTRRRRQNVSASSSVVGSI